VIVFPVVFTVFTIDLRKKKFEFQKYNQNEWNNCLCAETAERRNLPVKEKISPFSDECWIKTSEECEYLLLLFFHGRRHPFKYPPNLKRVSSHIICFCDPIQGQNVEYTML
jgi:hypothetical protein